MEITKSKYSLSQYMLKNIPEEWVIDNFGLTVRHQRKNFFFAGDEIFSFGVSGSVYVRDEDQLEILTELIKTWESYSGKDVTVVLDRYEPIGE